MLNDANWLPSTVVQASAAFVAITGGFLVTRLIAISSEISEFKTKISELMLKRRPVATDYLEIHTERRQADLDRFYDYWVGMEEMEKSDVDPDFLVDHYPLICGNREDLRETSKNIVSEYKNAKFILQNNVRSNELPNDSEEWLARYFTLDKFNLPIIQHVARVEHDKRSVLGFPNINISEPLRPVDDVYDEHQMRIEHENILEQKLSAIDSQIVLNRQEIAKRVVPRHFGVLIGLLSYMSIVGILIPAGAMAIDPVPTSSVFKFALIGLLGLGIIAFCIYLIAIVSSFVKEGTPITDAQISNSPDGTTTHTAIPE